MSICPKNKSSKGRRDKRRANWKMTAPALVKCSKCGTNQRRNKYGRFFNVDNKFFFQGLGRSLM